MRDVVIDVCEDEFGCVHAIKDLILREHIADGLPLWQDGRHMEQLLSLLFGRLNRLGTHTRDRLNRCYRAR